MIDDLVPEAQLPAAVALNGVVVNVGRAAGPALAGVLIAGVGPGAVFAINAVSFVGVLVVLTRWRRTTPPAPGPREGVGEAVAAGVRFVRFMPEITAVLVRTAAFIFSGSALWALIPIVARQELDLESVGYGTLLAFFGMGTIGWTGVRERVEEKLSPEVIVTGATVLFSAVMVIVALVRSLGALYVTMALGGVAWIALLTSFNVATQTAVPGWVRARGLATFQTVFMLGMGAGGAIWGTVAEQWGVRAAMLAAAAGVFRRSCDQAALADDRPVAPGPDDGRRPGTRTGGSRRRPAPRPRAGVGRVRHRGRRGRRFPATGGGLEPARRRTGASRWGLFQDTDRPRVFVEQFLVRSWQAHVRQHRLATAADRVLEQRVWRFHRGDGVPPTRHLLRVDDADDPPLHPDHPGDGSG